MVKIQQNWIVPTCSLRALKCLILNVVCSYNSLGKNFTSLRNSGNISIVYFSHVLFNIERQWPWELRRRKVFILKSKIQRKK